MVYRLAYMKKSGNRLFRCPDFVNHYNNPFSQTCQQPAFILPAGIYPSACRDYSVIQKSGRNKL
ncbi:TPA: hypothetical protein GE130_26445 [Escherichia coli]|nr:hypothetical protein [Escherichia coli]HAH4224395.1 hypothetical protein [Escherichia coli]HAH4269530.1 hypothetical protein [Escherichia coli]HAH4279650.1 hypothetical protein [Escherichia coli]